MMRLLFAPLGVEPYFASLWVAALQWANQQLGHAAL